MTDCCAPSPVHAARVSLDGVTPAERTALEVLTANGIQVRMDKDDGYTPTPVMSHAIIQTNRGRTSGFADGIIVTPSHNPPEDGGFKYNPPHGGPADTDVTKAIENRANELLAAKLQGVKRMPYEQALRAASTTQYDFAGTYIADLAHVVDLDRIKAANVPLIPEDFDRGFLPSMLKPYKKKCFGLTIDAQRLSQIRNERRPGSKYASLENCRAEVNQAESMMRREGIAWLSSTHKSIEEIATTILRDIRPDRLIY